MNTNNEKNVEKIESLKLIDLLNKMLRYRLLLKRTKRKIGLEMSAIIMSDAEICRFLSCKFSK